MMKHLKWGLPRVQNGIVVVIWVSSLKDGIRKEDMLKGRITVSIGGISANALFNSGTEIKTVWEDMAQEKILEETPSIYVKGTF